MNKPSKEILTKVATLEECTKCLKKKPRSEMGGKGICKICNNKQKNRVTTTSSSIK